MSIQIDVDMMDDDHFSVRGRIANFDKRNGGNPVYFNQWYLYANGARRESEPLGALIEPPDDEYLLAKNILQYHEARHAVAVRQFDNLKEDLAMSGCPQPEGLDQLRQLRQAVSQRNQAVNNAKTRLANTERGQELAAGRKVDAELRQSIEDYQDRLKAIRI
jgi:hypothetical protein